VRTVVTHFFVNTHVTVYCVGVTSTCNLFRPSNNDSWNDNQWQPNFKLLHKL